MKLQVLDVKKRYAAVQAVDGVSPWPRLCACCERRGFYDSCSSFTAKQ